MHVVFSCTLDAKITVLDANMSAPAYTVDGKPHSQWGLYYTGETAQTRITDKTLTVSATSDKVATYSNKQREPTVLPVPSDHM